MLPLAFNSRNRLKTALIEPLMWRRLVILILKNIIELFFILQTQLTQITNMWLVMNVARIANYSWKHVTVTHSVTEQLFLDQSVTDTLLK